ncbi:hypothetical protein ACH3Y3_00870 [Enterobacter hormaechei subsp. hoffmannii]|uniref:hypothetical protein n=1 Tax=Enterobacter hormaechei TaxID=158836 RepID=UPI0012AB3306|nr:hypothetical protein [Enterobacter hormaechei]
MSTTLKEWLQQTIAELEEERDAVPGAVNEDAVMALEAMKLALASLEAKPVAYVMAREDIDMDAASTSKVVVDSWVQEWNQGGEVRYRTVPLYTAPPASECLTRPVHPRISSEELDDETLDELIDFRRSTFEYHSQQGNKVQTIIHGVTLTAMIELKERRAAMLQGAEQTNYRAIVERIAEIIHGKVTDIDLLTVTVKSMKDKLQK